MKVSWGNAGIIMALGDFFTAHFYGFRTFLFFVKPYL